MNFSTFLFFCGVYFIVKKALEAIEGTDEVKSVDNNKITCDVLNGVSLDERKLRLANGYYNK